MMFGSIPSTCRAITDWPGEQTKFRRSSPFKAPWDRTLQLLKSELGQLSAKAVVLELAFREVDIRADGSGPKARAVARHPGVILSFTGKHGPLRIACDRFVSWQDNLRAIGLGLHDLRRLDRYGIVRRGEQYSGWRQIPAAAGNGVLSREEAARVLADLSSFSVSWILAGEGWRDAYRQAALRTHPDHGGRNEDFLRVQSARGAFGGKP